VALGQDALLEKRLQAEQAQHFIRLGGAIGRDPDGDLEAVVDYADLVQKRADVDAARRGPQARDPERLLLKQRQAALGKLGEEVGAEIGERDAVERAARLGLGAERRFAGAVKHEAGRGMSPKARQ